MNAKHKAFKAAVMEATSFVNDMKRKPPFALRLHCIEKGITAIPLCIHCGENEVSWNQVQDFDGVYKKVFAKFCSSKCSNRSEQTIAKKHKTLKDNYGGPSYLCSEEGKKRYADSIQRNLKAKGIDDPSITHPSQLPWYKEKYRKTCMERYGADDYMRSEEGKERVRKIVRERYGVDNAMQCEDVAERSLKLSDGTYRVASPETKAKIKSSFERFEGGHPMRDPKIKWKITQSNLAKYGVESPSQRHISERAIAILSDKESMEQMIEEHTFLSNVADELGVSFSAVQRSAANLGIPIKQTTSKSEDDLADLISGWGFDIVRNTREPLREYRREVDIFIPEANLCVEFNGVYWHSEIYKARDYHQRKSLAAHESGLSMVHVWEDDWNDPVKREIIIKKIKSKLVGGDERVFARKCVVEEIDTKEAKAFYEYNHIQGHVNGTRYIALRHGGNIVACVTFKDTGNGVFDLSRYATSVHVIGGLGKLMSYFKKTYDPSSVFTFASLDYSNGNLYEKTGFTRQHVTPPNLWYVKQGSDKRLNRHLFMKHKLKDRLDVFDESLTESENMRMNGFYRIYDSGSIRYEMTF